MAGIVKAGNLPNTTSLLNLVKGTPGSALAQSAKSTWFVPTAKNWTNVESANVLRNMLTKILTGKQTVRQAAKAASDRSPSILNAGDLSTAGGRETSVERSGPGTLQPMPPEQPSGRSGGVAVSTASRLAQAAVPVRR